MSNLPVKFVNFLKSRLIFNILYCFWMFVNKIFTYSHARISKSKRCFTVKSLTLFSYEEIISVMYYFQICISVPLIKKVVEVSCQYHYWFWSYKNFCLKGIWPEISTLKLPLFSFIPTSGDCSELGITNLAWMIKRY